MEDYDDIWLRATFEERESMRSFCSLSDEITQLVNTTAVKGPTITEVEGLESFLDGLENYQLSTTDDKSKIKSDFDLMINEACARYDGMEEHDVGGGLFSTIIKFIKNLWTTITEFFSNRLKTANRAVQRAKVSVKNKTVHPLKGYPFVAESLLIEGTRPNLKSIKWVADSIDIRRKFMGNVFSTFPILNKHIGKTLTADDFKSDNTAGIGVVGKRVHDLMTEAGDSLGKGFALATNQSGDKGINLPGLFFVVKESNLDEKIKTKISYVDFSCNPTRLNNLVAEMSTTKFVMVANHDVEALMKSVDSLNEEIKKNYKTPTYVCRQMEKLADKTFKESNLTGENKKEAAKMFKVVLNIAKTLTSGQFYAAVRNVEAGIAVINKCLADKD